MILLVRFTWCIFVCSLLITASPALSKEPSLWRFGFYWPLTVEFYPPSLIPWSSYTHVTQMAILPTKSCGLDDTFYNPKGTRKELVATAHAHGVKALITLLHDKPLKAIKDCTKPAKIDAFVATLVNHIKTHGYDGIDLDWEAGIIPSHYKALVRRLRAALPDRVLTVDIGVHQRGYVASVQDKIDRINLMNYDMGITDYHGKRLSKTWHNAAIRSIGDVRKFKSAEANLYYMLSSGIEPGKINLGVPFYGYIVQSCVTNQKFPHCPTGVRRPAQTFSTAGIHRKQVFYYQLVGSPYMNGAVSWDNERKAPYISYKGTTANCFKIPCLADAFITYPDPRQMQEAVALLLEKKLGGIMTFALHQEYLSDKTGEERYPLTTAIMRELHRRGR